MSGHHERLITRGQSASANAALRSFQMPRSSWTMAVGVVGTGYRNLYHEFRSHRHIV